MKLRRFLYKKVYGLCLIFAFFAAPAASAKAPEGPADSAKVTTEEHGAAAEAHEKGHEQKPFNAGEMIMEHITDAYEWHVFTYKDFHATIPLPVILLNNGELDIFSSGKFHHGHDTVRLANGHAYFMNEKHKIESLDGSKFYDFSITKNVMALFVSALLLLWIFLSIAGFYKKRKGKAPKGMQSLLEPLILFIRDEVAKPSIGKNYNRYMPYLLTVFFFIWLNNLLGLIPIAPFGANLTGNIAVTLTLALITFVITLLSSKKDYWTHIFNTPGVPLWLKLPVPLMPVVELLGVFIKPFVLMLRLFANITAGHIIPLGFFALIFIFGQMSPATGYGISVVSVFFSLFMSVLELLVAFLQAYIFTLLSAMYFGMALEEHHHDTEHH